MIYAVLSQGNFHRKENLSRIYTLLSVTWKCGSVKNDKYEVCVYDCHKSLTHIFWNTSQQAVCWLAAASAGEGGYSVHCSLLTEEIQTSRCILQCNCDAMHWKSVLLRRGTELVPLVVVQTVSLLERGQNKMYLWSNFEAANKTMFSLILGTRTKIETGKSATAFYIHI